MRESSWVVALAALAALGLGTLAGADVAPAVGDSRPQDRDDIRQHIDTIFHAFMDKNREKVRATHGAQWRGFLNNSRSIVRGIDEYMREAEEFLDNPARLTGYEMRDYDLVFYGNVAVITYISDLELAVGEERISSTLRVLDIYAKQNGHWIQVASNTNTHPDALEASLGESQTLTEEIRQEAVAAREALWRAWFANDEKFLQASFPENLLAIPVTGVEWIDRDEVFTKAKQFVDSGSRLVSLAFPNTVARMFGGIVVLYEQYKFEIENNGQTSTLAGRGTEMLQKRGDHWITVGWHLDILDDEWLANEQSEGGQSEGGK